MYQPSDLNKRLCEYLGPNEGCFLLALTSCFKFLPFLASYLVLASLLLAGWMGENGAQRLLGLTPMSPSLPPPIPRRSRCPQLAALDLFLLGVSACAAQWHVCSAWSPCHSQMVMHRILTAWDLSIGPQHGKPFFWS